LDINLNVSINAPELCASINNLATALLMQKTTAVTGVTDIPVDKSNFTFDLNDAVVAKRLQEEKNAATDKPEQVDATVQDAATTTDTADKVETATETTETAATADNKPATEEPPKEEVQKVELEVIRGILKGKVEAGKKDKVAAFLASYDVKKLTDIPADKFTTEMQAKAEAI